MKLVLCRLIADCRMLRAVSPQEQCSSWSLFRVWEMDNEVDLAGAVLGIFKHGEC